MMCVSLGNLPSGTGGKSVTKLLLRALIASSAIVALCVVPAYAYNETDLQDGRVCSDCHGLESSSQDTSVVVGGRKGPHGGYSAGTQKCDTCHTVHGAQGSKLLKGATIVATCTTCHDGTGGGGVYGAIRSHAATTPLGGHRVFGSSPDATVGTSTVPGGVQTGTFVGENGELTCTDCHSPHNSDTVNPYVGDRKRASTETSTVLATNRLLRRKPTLGTVAVNEYGTNWCESCHKGGHMVPSSSHSVSRDASGTGGTYYNRIIARNAYGSTAASSGPTSLGGSNLGYVMATDTPRPSPICQQCHEDARHVGDVATFTVNAAAEAFVVNADGTAGNPRFQNFPHETMGRKLLIEQGSDLCTNCH